MSPEAILLPFFPLTYCRNIKISASHVSLAAPFGADMGTRKWLHYAGPHYTVLYEITIEMEMPTGNIHGPSHYLARWYDRVLFSYRLSGLPGDTHKKVVQEVGAASEAQDGVGQLKGEMSRLAQLTSFRKTGRDRKIWSVRIKISAFCENLKTTFWRRQDGYLFKPSMSMSHSISRTATAYISGHIFIVLQHLYFH